MAIVKMVAQTEKAIKIDLPSIPSSGATTTRPKVERRRLQPEIDYDAARLIRIHAKVRGVSQGDLIGELALNYLPPIIDLGESRSREREIGKG